MNYLGIGDLATSANARRQNSILRTELTRLTAELSSGQRADVSKAMRGHLAPMASIERSLMLNEAFSNVAQNAALKLDVADSALRSIESSLNGLGASILGAANMGPAQVDTVLAGAANNLEATISALSVQISGSYVFSGVADRTAPLVNAEELLDELEVITSGATTATDFRDRIVTWFDSPGGFEAFGYLGSETSLNPVQISSTESFVFEVNALSDEIRNLLSGFATITLIDQGGFSGSEEEKLNLVKSTAEDLLEANDDLIGVQAKIGEAQQGVTRAQVQNGSEEFLLINSKNKILGVDAFSVATQLEQIQFQLESFYLITAKTSNLNLTEYLR